MVGSASIVLMSKIITTELKCMFSYWLFSISVDCWCFKGNSHSVRLCRVCSLPHRMPNSVQMYQMVCHASLHTSFAFAFSCKLGLTDDNFTRVKLKLREINVIILYSGGFWLVEFESGIRFWIGFPLPWLQHYSQES